MKDDFEKYLDMHLKNPNFKKEYEMLAPECAIIQTLIDAQKELGLHKRNSPKKQA